ncbi:MAG: alpha/beta hydrolase family protein [Candidatus Latescibacteria bacterium]|nr:alpha/beta hydrolase family protein [Candidatus Latescibacterota bacterium]
MYNAADHFQATYHAFSPEFRFQAKTQEDLQQWQAAFRPRLRTILGLDNLEADLTDHVPTAVCHQEDDLGDIVREHWHLWTEPTVPLPFYLIRPKQIEGRVPLVLMPHGHNHPRLYAGLYEGEEEKQHMLGGERDLAIQAAREGYIAIAPTTRAFGETRTEKDKERNSIHSCQLQLRHGLLAGRTPIGERVWDMSRLIDWALANLGVNPDKIAMTGNSGGGTITVFAAACETRISVAMPGCYFCTFEGSIGSINHCDCNYVPGILRFGEMYDVAGLIAPRPFNAIAGRDDPIFPIDQVKFAYGKLKEIYTVAGVPEQCKLYIGDGGHRYYKAGAWPFLRQYFGSGKFR